MFFDFKEENLRILNVIDDRRSRRKLELPVQALFQEEDGKEELLNCTAVDYIPELEKYVINLKGYLFMAGRVRLTFNSYETNTQVEKRRKVAASL
jgi:hypothetical protein